MDIADRPVPRLRPGVDLGAYCAAWATAEPLARLVRAWGAEPPDPQLPTAELYAALDDFSQVWDFRRRRERNEAREPDFSADQRALVDAATAALGVQDTEPPSRRDYDHVLVLGGLSRGCLARPLHAARLLADGAIAAPRVTALCGLRPLNEGEMPLLRAFGLQDATTEFDVMDAGVRRAFGLDGLPDVEQGDGPDETARWHVHRYTLASGTAVDVVAAPSRRGGARANTADTYAWLAGPGGVLRRGDAVLVVTTYHYRLYQLVDAVRELQLPHGIEVDAVGMVPGEVDERLAWRASTGALLQETRSAIRALGQLHRAL